MITVEKYGIILSPTDLEFENNATFDPGVIQDGNTVHILYRATQHGNFSTIGYAKTEGPLKIVERKIEPLVSRDFAYETHGLEDTQININQGAESTLCFFKAQMIMKKYTQVNEAQEVFSVSPLEEDY